MINAELTYTQARQNLASAIKTCTDDCRSIIIRSRSRAVAMIPLSEYESLKETAYLLSSPANARRLRASIKSAKAGKLVKISPEDIA